MPVTHGTALLTLSDVSRVYGDREAVSGVSFALHPGQCVALMGDNGAGKSTLLRLAAGRERPTSGTVLFDGTPVDADDRRTRARIATVMDPAAFYPDLTVREHLTLVALAHGPVEGAADLVDAVLADHHLADHADVLPWSLSSGQTQQLLLAAAFVRPHDLLILDEPEQRLDTGARAELARRLAVHKDRDVAVLLATHHEELADAVADDVLDMAAPVPEPTAGPGR
ncbi:ABC transporter ATP-binding protein [Streptomyces sp. B1866]|uniref:ABC transporter ATP-binding protein n=1 Tax=Streptomyces sp. B1866 TaxID=3075431 RepID=UPI00288EBBFF|nr:ABC transporter ATP-binding protein [Streptomyces sp. B1866]MDT3400525.1 ABC transporter ATP-binding protein [Streptomyces sp. B1866]